MPDRTLLRIGSVSAVLGAILLMVANAIHPRGDLEDAAATLKEIADSDIWVTDHLGIAVGALLVLGGLVAIYRSITTEPGAVWARLGFAGALVSTGLLYDPDRDGWNRDQGGSGSVDGRPGGRDGSRFQSSRCIA